jgi:hypothetical protein
MLRAAFFIASFVLTSVPTVVAQVQRVGDVSFAVPDGWTYQQGVDFGAMTVKADNRFWVVAVYSAMPSSGNPNADFKTAWKRVVSAVPDRPGVLSYDPYNLTGTVGYGGKYFDDANNHTTYTRLYVLETGKTFVPVAYISVNRSVLDSMEHNASAIVSSVRVSPLSASAIKYSIHVTDLTGYWKSGVAVSTGYYNSAGQYQNSSLTAVGAEYTIGAGGDYTYKAAGLLNNRAVNDDDAGVVELGGEFVTFKGHKRVTRYRFLNLQQALDGSTVMTLLPPVDMSQISVGRDSSYWTRPVKK